MHFIAAATMITALSCNAASWPLRITATGVAAATAVIGYKTVKNYTALVPLHEKVQSEHVLLGDSRAQSTSMYRWKRDFWPTARAMQCDRENVKRAFSAAFVNKELVVCNAANSIICQPTWLDIKAAINREKDELRKDLIFLENNFLTIKPILPFMNSRGFMYDYKAACKAVGVDPYANMSWNEIQEQHVETLVKNIYNQKTPVVCGLPNLVTITGFNYSLAASIYWRLFKLFKRLEVLEGIVSELAVGYDAVYIRPQESSVNVVLH
jgi:hypothetical protein